MFVRSLFFCLVVLASFSNAWSEQPLIVQTARKQVVLSGYTRGRTSMALSAEVAGKVVRVNYDVGQAIDIMPFAEIDDTFLVLQIERARLTISKLKVARSQATSQIDYLDKEFKRINALKKDKAATQARWDAAREQLDQASLSLRSANTEISSLQTQLQELEERHRRHQVMAPQGWVVVQRHVEPGEVIAAGTPLARLVDFSRLVVPLFVSGPELAALRRDDTIALKVAGSPAKGVINWVNPEFDERSRKSAVELAVTDFEGEKRGGLLAELNLMVDTRGLMVPKAAVTDYYDNPQVVRAADGKSISITPLGESDDFVLIADQTDLLPGMALASAQTTRHGNVPEQPVGKGPKFYKIK
ncbi:MAG: HlyD family efflux transporter periplasmic adaptor subunit [Desulfatitalea sp.]|nr:HlyD family efflux transporter periplasmic adaptor subunit [Desulfatitalea sp.]NNJ98833.1 HlyD family efflux transporter periplasmic adaptor subunit [Desulfatitalea sp.]